jgi:hypothetical protein
MIDFLPSFVKRDERVLIVWADELDRIIPLCAEFEEKIMKLVWRSRTRASSVLSSTTNSVTPSTTASNVNLNEKTPTPITDAAIATVLAGKEIPGAADEPPTSTWKWGWKLSKARPSAAISDDLEKGPAGQEARPIRLFAPIYGGLGLGLSAFFMASGVATVLAEWRLDHSYSRFALFSTIPLLFCISLVSFTDVLRALRCLKLSISSVLLSPDHSKLELCVRHVLFSVDATPQHSFW